MNLIHMAAIKHITFNKISSTCIYNCVAMKHTPQTILLSLALFVQLVVLYHLLFCTIRCSILFVVLYNSLFCIIRCKFQVFNMIQFSFYNMANTQVWRVHYFGTLCILRSLEISSTEVFKIKDVTCDISICCVMLYIVVNQTINVY